MANELQWVSTILFVALATSSITESASLNLSKIHHHMTKNELLSVFKVPDVESVPDYEIATVTHAKHRSRRSIHGRNRQTYYMNSGKTVLALRNVDNLLLDENTPVYLASGDRSQPHGIRYTRKRWPSKLSVYRDYKKQAVVSLSEGANVKNHRPRFEGIIGNDYVIKPIPSRFLDDDNNSHHLIYKRQINRNDAFDYLPGGDHIKMAQYASNVDVVYPEILVIVDYSMYRAHGSNLQQLCKYMATFWHAVDARYRALSQPQVRLNIAGLIVSTDNYGTPYISRNSQGRYLFPSNVIDDLARYLSWENRLGTFDLPIAITNLDLCKPNGYGSCNNNVLGMATIGGACLNGVAAGVIEDQMDMSGVNTATHELGHLFNSQHDGDNGYCDSRDGYLMAPDQSYTSNGNKWSQCSLQQMRGFFRTNAGCLRNKPQINRPIDIDEEPVDDSETRNEWSPPINNDYEEPQVYYDPRWEYVQPGCCCEYEFDWNNY